MKHLLAFGMLTLGLALALASCGDGKQAENTDSEEQNTPASLADYDFARLNYALGASAGFFVKDQGVKLDAEQFLKGLRDAAEGKSTMNEKDCQIELEKYLALEQEFKAQEQLRMGDRFLDSMAKLPGVVRDSSGLLYRIDVEGTGAQPTDSSYVSVNYVLTLVNGQVLDSSATGQPILANLKNMIRGWSIGVSKFREGGKGMLYIPPDLAYGVNGRPGIPGNATLVFSIGLEKVLTKEEYEKGLRGQ